MTERRVVHALASCPARIRLRGEIGGSLRLCEVGASALADWDLVVEAEVLASLWFP